MSGGPAPLRAAIVCPGRGSYGRAELGSLARALDEGVGHARTALGAIVAELDALRAERGLDGVMELDAAERFSARTHLRADHASALILAGAAADLGLVHAAWDAGAIEPVVVCGNSLGFYTALFASGALGVADAARLVDTMAAIQVERGAEGGQLVYPTTDDAAWTASPARERAVAEAIRAAGAAGGRAFVSIRLGGNVVLAGDDVGVRALMEALPPIERKGLTFPLRLAGHSAFHTALMEAMSATAQERLSMLGWKPPRLPLVDGRGFVWRPLHADPEALRRYTLETQVTGTYDFTASVRVALREYAPDLLVLLGPGDSLGGPVGQILVAERWAEIRGREDFARRQRGDAPIVLSLGRSSDRVRLLDRLGDVAAA
jgi:acyl transferase domain-containing protein